MLPVLYAGYRSRLQLISCAKFVLTIASLLLGHLSVRELNFFSYLYSRLIDGNGCAARLKTVFR